MITERHLNRALVDQAVSEAVARVVNELNLHQSIARGGTPYPVKGNLTRDANGNKVERWNFSYPLDGTRPLG